MTALRILAALAPRYESAGWTEAPNSREFVGGNVLVCLVTNEAASPAFPCRECPATIEEHRFIAYAGLCEACA